MKTEKYKILNVVMEWSPTHNLCNMKATVEVAGVPQAVMFSLDPLTTTEQIFGHLCALFSADLNPCGQPGTSLEIVYRGPPSMDLATGKLTPLE